jgi:DDE superfamily endonuclease
LSTVDLLDVARCCCIQARTNARALPGERAYDFKPFYRGSKFSVIGAITSSKILAVMTIDNSMNSDVFEVYISKLLAPQL